MGRRHDLGKHILESYDMIHQYEQIIHTSNRPEEVARAKRKIDEQWGHIEGYINEYVSLCQRLQLNIPNDLLEIITHFPEVADRLQDSVLNQATGDLQGVLRDEGLSEPEQAAQTIAATIPAERPLLFKKG